MRAAASDRTGRVYLDFAEATQRLGLDTVREKDDNL